jgi:predicted RNase H-like HicB family nuclease
MIPNYEPIIRRDGKWWIGWIEEIPGVNAQGKTRQELMENLGSALREALKLNDTPSPLEETDRAAIAKSEAAIARGDTIDFKSAAAKLRHKFLGRHRRK